MKNHWHSLFLDEIFKQMKSSPEGLGAKEADARLKTHGPNVLPKERRNSKLRLFLSQFNSPLMYILITTVFISFALGHYSDTILICIVLLINTTVGFYQENKANNSLLALSQMVRIRAKVLRDGQEKEIDSENLVPGDVILLRSGDKVPADARIIEERNLKVNEASLTGEWQAVRKDAGAILGEDVPVSERVNMVLMGTIVEEGETKAMIVGTGLGTQFGEVVSLLKQEKETKTPLQKKITSLSKLTGAFVLSVISVIIIVGYFTEKSFADIFVAALALAVSSIPEGLLPAITVILVLGMRRILRQKGLVRKLAANETLGSVTVICTDKTGTLTEGKMQVSHILTSTSELLNGGFNGLAKGEKANGIESHISALKIAVLANEAFVENPEAELEEWVVRGRSTEQALLLAGMQAGLDKDELEKQYPVVDKIAFGSDLKYTAFLRRVDEQKNILLVLGAPEVVIEKCAFLDIDGKKKEIKSFESEKLFQKLDLLAQKGLRVLACASKELPSADKKEDLAQSIDGLSLIGLIAIKDPLRPDAKESIDVTKRAGIRTILVTGDHRLTAKAIAQELGLDVRDEFVVEGREIEEISDEDLKEKTRHITVYARVSPKHKLRLVKALQENGEVVAMLGDGINDAPALKAADIGVAVGSGTDVAKEVADLVLLDDSFKTITKAIEQGRLIFQNIRKVFVYLVADDFAELFLFLGAMMLGLPLPLVAAQILWINLVEDGFPSIALTAEQETQGVMDEKPRSPKESLLNRPMKLWMSVIFCVTGLAAFLLFYFFLKTTGDLERTRTILFGLVCVDSLLFAFCVRSFRQSIFRRSIFSNRYLAAGTGISMALLVLAIYLPPLQKLLSTQAISWGDWLLIFAIAFVEIILIELFKKRLFGRVRA